jgi:hypothetical protein
MSRKVLIIYNLATFSPQLAVSVSVGAQAEDSGFGDGLDLADFVEDGILRWAIDAHQRNSFRAARGLSPAQSESRDVDAQPSKRAAYLADDSGFIVIS